MSLADARNQARQVLAGRVTPAPRNGQTFEDLTNIFFERLHVRPKTEEEYRRIIEVELLPAWGSTQVARIARDDVFKVLDPIIKRGSRTQANRVHQVIVALLHLAVDRGWTQMNVASGIRRPGGREVRRERTLTVGELVGLWLQLDKHCTRPTAQAIRFLMFTGQRRNEVLGLVWREIDFESNVWTLPGARAKNRREHTIPLNRMMRQILSEQWVSPDGIRGPDERAKVFASAARNMSPVMKRLCEAARISPATAHDLRRSAATIMASNGVPRVVLASILNHVDMGPTAIYDRSQYAAEKIEAMDKLDAAIREPLARAGYQSPITSQPRQVQQ
jgi:integrase